VLACAVSGSTPGTVPSVMVVCAVPVASLVAFAGETLPPFAAEKDTLVPGTGFPYASLRVTAHRCGSTVPTMPAWPFPDGITIRASGPARAVSVKWIERPLAVAVACWTPARVPSVKAVWTRPLELVTPLSGERVPPEMVRNFTVTPGTGRPCASSTSTTSAAGSVDPAAPC